MQTRIDSTKKIELHAFDSLGELGLFIANTPKVWGPQYNQAHTNMTTDDWDLGAGYEGAVNMASNGWPEGAQRAQEALQAFPAMSPQPDTRTDVYGFRPHVPRFCAGAPDSMIRHANVAETGAGRVLTLAVALDANAGTRAQHMANFGIAVAQYINQLETDGTRIELIGVLVGTYTSSGWRSAQSVTLKKADQPIDLAVIAFAIGHPAMLRRIGFALIERTHIPPMHSYGSAVPAKLSDLINPPPGTVILNGMVDAGKLATTPAKALEYVSKQIEAALKAQEL